MPESSKFNIAYYSKALVPLLLIVVYYINQFFNWNIQLGETEAVFITSIFLSALVFFIPNKSADSVTVEIPAIEKVAVPNDVVVPATVVVVEPTSEVVSPVTNILRKSK